MSEREQLQVAAAVDRMLSRDSTSELAARAAGQIVEVSKDAPKELREQVIAYQVAIANIFKQYLDHVVTAERVQFSKALRDMDRAELIPLVAKRLRQQE